MVNSNSAASNCSGNGNQIKTPTALSHQQLTLVGACANCGAHQVTQVALPAGAQPIAEQLPPAHIGNTLDVGAPTAGNRSVAVAKSAMRVGVAPSHSASRNLAAASANIVASTAFGAKQLVRCVETPLGSDASKRPSSSASASTAKVVHTKIASSSYQQNQPPQPPLGVKRNASEDHLVAMANATTSCASNHTHKAAMALGEFARANLHDKKLMASLSKLNELTSTTTSSGRQDESNSSLVNGDSCMNNTSQDHTPCHLAAGGPPLRVSRPRGGSSDERQHAATVLRQQQNQSSSGGGGGGGGAGEQRGSSASAHQPQSHANCDMLAGGSTSGNQQHHRRSSQYADSCQRLTSMSVYQLATNNKLGSDSMLWNQSVYSIDYCSDCCASSYCHCSCAACLSSTNGDEPQDSGALCIHGLPLGASGGGGGGATSVDARNDVDLDDYDVMCESLQFQDVQQEPATDQAGPSGIRRRRSDGPSSAGNAPTATDSQQTMEMQTMNALLHNHNADEPCTSSGRTSSSRTNAKVAR